MAQHLRAGSARWLRADRAGRGATRAAARRRPRRRCAPIGAFTRTWRGGGDRRRRRAGTPGGDGDLGGSRPAGNVTLTALRSRRQVSAVDRGARSSRWSSCWWASPFWRLLADAMAPVLARHAARRARARGRQRGAGGGASGRAADRRATFAMPAISPDGGLGNGVRRAAPARGRDRCATSNGDGDSGRRQRGGRLSATMPIARACCAASATRRRSPARRRRRRRSAVHLLRRRRRAFSTGSAGSTTRSARAVRRVDVRLAVEIRNPDPVPTRADPRRSPDASIGAAQMATDAKRRQRATQRGYALLSVSARHRGSAAARRFRRRCRRASTC